ncbi:MAG: dephospho-CoA kinase [Pseudomonadota bacterium]|jgi:dephospho-CoA kinase|nr:MAG: dephospho-CoA kinase [Pseudomonadota bacterium]
MAGRRPSGPRKVLRIALTGGIASGKSTVARLFTTLGAKLIDTDQVARDIVVPPSPVLDRIVARFGPSVLAADGTLDRAALRRIVFQDEAARRDLEAIMHPAIRAETDRRSAEAGGPYQLIAIPLLVETGTAGQYDRVLLVDASPETQRMRLMLRDGMTAEAAGRMLAAQASREARRAIAHDIIDNDGDVAALAPQVEALHRRYLALAATS